MEASDAVFKCQSAHTQSLRQFVNRSLVIDIVLFLTDYLPEQKLRHQKSSRELIGLNLNPIGTLCGKSIAMNHDRKLLVDVDLLPNQITMQFQMTDFVRYGKALPV